MIGSGSPSKELTGARFSPDEEYESAVMGASNRVDRRKR